MKKVLKITGALMAAILALSSVACNSASVDENTKNNEDVIISNVAEDNAQASESLAKDLLLINSNGIIDESKRAALEAGVYMPDPIMNGAPEGTYPIQGFILSSSTPADTYGNGMSIVYRLSDGSLLVFDSGSSTVKYMFYKCLKDLAGGGKIKIAAWVLTHAHGDHYGAMYDLLNGIYKEEFEIQEFWYNRANNTADANGVGVNLVNLFNKLAKGETKVRALEYGKTYTLDSGKISAKVLCTPDKVAGRSGLDENTNSLVMMLTIVGKKILMTGDANEPAWNFMVSQHNASSEYSLKCDYLQMPHHAVHAAGTAAGYNAANPSYVIIPSTTKLAKDLCTSSNANPTYNFLKNTMGINTQSSNLPQVGSNYCYAGSYTQNGTKNIVCFFTIAQ